MEPGNEAAFAKTFPALKKVEVVIFDAAHQEDDITYETAKRKILEYYASAWGNAAFAVTVTGVDHHQPDSYDCE